MSRFEYMDYEEGIPQALWENALSNALAGRRGQLALAMLEQALLALPEYKLIEGHLAAEGQVCVVGAYVAYREALEKHIDITSAIKAIQVTKCYCGHARHLHFEGGDGCIGINYGGSPCYCQEFDFEESDIMETADAGTRAGLTYIIAWHMAYLNDEEMRDLTPEKRFDRMLTWVRRAQGKVPA